MTYKINGREVSKEAFLNAGVGFDFSRPLGGATGGFTPFQSPIDGKWITNSAELSGHNREYGVQQVGNEFINKKKDN